MPHHHDHDAYPIPNRHAFSIQAQRGRARAGRIDTPHGPIFTPAFFFCATRGTLKGLSIPQIVEAQTQVLLSNTYHLMLKPGSKAVAARGGLHAFIGWPGPMFTDSGGFQVFSLGHGSVADEIKGRNRSNARSLLRISEDGATFRSYWDGSVHHLTPELAMNVQKDLGADLVAVFDECTPFHIPKEETARAMHRSHRWAARSLEAFAKSDDGTQGLYGIVQGGVYPDLRSESAEFINNQPFFGHAIGGSLGDTSACMHAVVDDAASKLDGSRPIHLLGIGGIADILHGVACGIDTFDCVHPTRIARHGTALVRPKHHPSENATQIDLRRARFATDDAPLEPDCPCSTCTYYTRAYLHHLFKNRELLGPLALTQHNVCFMNRLMDAVRTSLLEGTFEAVCKEWAV